MLRVSYLPSCLFSSPVDTEWVSAAAFFRLARSCSSWRMTWSRRVDFIF